MISFLQSLFGFTVIFSANEFATLGLERTTLSISDKLPGILRWFQVTETKIDFISPVCTAIETMEKTNNELKKLILEQSTIQDKPLNPLTQKLSGVIDAAVMGGIGNYEKVRQFKNYTYLNFFKRYKQSSLVNFRQYLSKKI